MKKVKMMMLFGIMLISMSSCVSLFENIDCEDGRTDPDHCENFELKLGENCE